MAIQGTRPQVVYKSLNALAIAIDALEENRVPLSTGINAVRAILFNPKTTISGAFRLCSKERFVFLRALLHLGVLTDPVHALVTTCLTLAGPHPCARTLDLALSHFYAVSSQWGEEWPTALALAPSPIQRTLRHSRTARRHRQRDIPATKQQGVPALDPNAGPGTWGNPSPRRLPFADLPAA